MVAFDVSKGRLQLESLHDWIWCWQRLSAFKLPPNQSVFPLGGHRPLIQLVEDPPTQVGHEGVKQKSNNARTLKNGIEVGPDGSFLTGLFHQAPGCSIIQIAIRLDGQLQDGF